MNTYEVQVYLSEDFRTTAFGYNRNVIYKQAAWFTLQADTIELACEVVFSTLNRDIEMFSPGSKYADIARMYRFNNNRSFSVGDLIEFITEDGVRQFACERFGFKEILNETQDRNEPR